MHAVQERRSPGLPRVGIEWPVELSLAGAVHSPLTVVGGQRSAKAEATNIGTGGLSLRAQEVPELGARLLCRFESLDGGVVSTECQVVWVETDAGRPSEFGLRFIGMSEEARDSIERMVVAGLPGDAWRGAELAAEDSGLRRMGGVQPSAHRTGSGRSKGEPLSAPTSEHWIRASVAESSRGCHIEVPLPFLGGEGQDWFADKAASGSVVRGVSLRFDPRPRLVVEIGRGDSSEAGDGIDGIGSSANEPGVAHPYRGRDVASPDAGDSFQSSGLDPSYGSVSAVARPAASTDTVPDRHLSSLEVGPSYGGFEVDEYSAAGVRFDDSSFAQASLMTAGVDPDAPTWPRAVADMEAAQRRSSLVGWKAKLQEVIEASRPRWRELQGRCQHGWAILADRLRQVAFDLRTRSQHWQQSWRNFRGHRMPWRSQARHTSPTPVHYSGTLPLRRSTAASRWAEPASSLARRLPGVLVFALAALLGAALTFALLKWWQRSDRGEALAAVTTPHALTRDTRTSVGAGRPSPDSPTAAVEDGEWRANPSGLLPHNESVAEGVAVGSHGGLQRSFGTPQAPSGRAFLLRMSAPVRGVQGTTTPRGFRVLVPGSVALDGASALAESDRRVADAHVINYGDHAVLIVDFVDRKRPPYHVAGRGSALEITLGD